jgi:hypothetical protein
MIAAIRLVDVMRNGTEFFSADSPPFYDNKGAGDDVFQADNSTGCDNNHGFEGLTVTRGGNTLYVLMQAPLNQDGGTNKQTERYTRLVEYDITVPSATQYARELVVPLPPYNDPTAKASKNPKWQRSRRYSISKMASSSFWPETLVLDTASHLRSQCTATLMSSILLLQLTSRDLFMAVPTCCVATDAGVLNSASTPATFCDDDDE